MRYSPLLLALFLPLTCFCEAPRGYIARPLEAGVSYNQHARDAYTAGTWILDELAAADAPPDEAAARHIYERAQAAFDEAVRAEPAMYEAHTYLGYIHRKLGRFETSLIAYEKALELKPDYVHAIEYQGEAFLGQDDFQRARFNYLRLYALDQTLAAKLLDAMHEWANQSPHGHEQELTNARAWIAQRRSR